MSPLRELANFLKGWGFDLRCQRNYPALLEVETLQDIAMEVIAERMLLKQKAYSAEQADLEAARLLQETLDDNQVTEDEIPALRRALRHVLRSAEHDHFIGQTASPW